MYQRKCTQRGIETRQAERKVDPMRDEKRRVAILTGKVGSRAER